MEDVRSQQQRREQLEQEEMERKLREITRKATTIDRKMKKLRRKQQLVRQSNTHYESLHQNQQVNHSQDMVRTYQVVKHYLDKSDQLKRHREELAYYRNQPRTRPSRTQQFDYQDEPRGAQTPNYMLNVKPRVANLKDLR